MSTHAPSTVASAPETPAAAQPAVAELNKARTMSIKEFLTGTWLDPRDDNKEKRNIDSLFGDARVVGFLPGGNIVVVGEFDRPTEPLPEGASWLMAWRWKSGNIALLSDGTIETETVTTLLGALKDDPRTANGLKAFRYAAGNPMIVNYYDEGGPQQLDVSDMGQYTLVFDDSGMPEAEEIDDETLELVVVKLAPVDAGEETVGR